MSHAPVRRKSRQAMAAALPNSKMSKTPAPAPHLVVLRVKRKRGDAAFESLLVAPDEQGFSDESVTPDRKRRATGGTGSIEETLADLTLAKAEKHGDCEHNQRVLYDAGAVVQQPKRLFYKRLRTTEPDGSRDRRKQKSSSVMVAPPVSHDALRDTTASITVGGTTRGGGGGRLEARLSSRAAGPPSVMTPPRPAAAIDFMEVRRVKARAIEQPIAKSLKVKGTSRPGGCEEQSTISSSTVAASTTVAPADAPANFHVIDLQAVGLGDAADMDISGVDKKEREIPKAKGGNAEKRPAAPILTPVERQMDEAIFHAFQSGNMSRIRDILTASSCPLPASVNYRRRLGDTTTALMAAAFHGDLDTVRHLLSLGAKASLADANGKTAAFFAGMRGHRQCFAELQRIADVEEEEQRALSSNSHIAGEGGGGGRSGGHDFVYDLYYFEPSASSPEGGPATGGDGLSAVPTAGSNVDKKVSDTAGVAPPVVRLSGIGPVDENAVGATMGVELVFEHDSDWSELGDSDDGEDPDSNSEGYYGNDYPEDEGDEDGGMGANSAPYVYDCGSGSSCESEGRRSSSADDVFDSDSDNEPYCRRVVEMPTDEDDVFGDNGGVSSTLQGTAEGVVHEQLGNSGMFTWAPKR